MKKLIVLCGLATLSTSLSFAYFESTKTSDIDILRAQGYSESTLQVVDWANATNKGQDSTYVRHFVKKQPKGKLGKAYTNLKLYVDPSQDDGLFGEHQINFTNTWNGDNTKYSTRVMEKEKIEDL